MRFNSRPYFFSAALLIAAAAHAETGGAGMGRSRVDSDLTPRTAETAPDTNAERTYADGADAQAAPCHPEASQAAQPAANAAKKGTMIMVAPDPEDPDLQRIWSGP